MTVGGSTGEAYAEYLKTHATPEELQRILGPKWAICRATENNRQKYGRCITQKQYEAANAQAVRERNTVANGEDPDEEDRPTRSDDEENGDGR
jgi:hypothetical protein